MSYVLQQGWLPCGCRRGFFLCAEVRVLWAAVGAAYRAASGNKFVDWSAYAEARAAYENHFGADIKPAMIRIPEIVPCP